MEGSLNGGVDTIQRPQLPPLPSATRAARGIPDPFRGPAAGTQVEGLEPPAAVVAEATPASIEIVRAELPPTPPPLRPFAVANKSEAVAAQEAKKNNRVEEIRNARVADTSDAVDSELSESAQSYLSQFDVSEPDESQSETSGSVRRPETPAAILALEQKKLTTKEARKAEKARAKKVKAGTSEAGTTKTGKTDKVTGSGSSNPLRLVAALALLVVLVVLGFFGSRLLGGGANVSDLSVGECIESFFETDDSGSFIEISALNTVDCAQPHAYEVFAVSDQVFPNDEYPGVEASFTTGEEFCLNEYEAFIGGGRSNLRTWEVWTFVPPEASWDGDRRVQCVVGDIDQQELVVGSLQGIADGS